MDFGGAIKAAKEGKKVARLGWNGAGMFAYIVPPNSYPRSNGCSKKFFWRRWTCSLIVLIGL